MCYRDKLVYLCITCQITLKGVKPKLGSHWMQSSPSDSLLLVFSFHCFLLHLTLTFTWFIPRLLSHSSCQANKRLFAFPWRLMPRPGRETECREAGGKPVAGGYQKGRIDVCWPRLGGNSGWWNRWRVVTSVTIKLGPVRLQPMASNPVATISTVLSMLCVCAWAVTLSHSRHASNTQSFPYSSLQKITASALKSLTISTLI